MPVQSIQERHRAAANAPNPEGPHERQRQNLHKAWVRRVEALRDELLKASEKFDMLPESPALTTLKMEAQTATEDPTDENLDRMYTIAGDYLARSDILPLSSQLDRLRKLQQDVEQPNPLVELEANLTTGFAASASSEGEFRVAASFAIPVGEAGDHLPGLEMDVDDAIRLDATGFRVTGSESMQVISNTSVVDGERIHERILVPTITQADLDNDDKLWVRVLHGELEIIPLEPFDPEEFSTDDEPGEPNRVGLLTELWWEPAPPTPRHRDTRYYPHNEEHFITYSGANDKWELHWYGEKIIEGSLPYVRDTAMRRAISEVKVLEDAELEIVTISPEDVDE